MRRERCVHIIDDEAKVRDALTLLLSTAQIESRSFASAEEYLASVPLKEPACILLDNQLPGMSGIELLKRITGAASNSAVIMITGYGDVPTAVSAMKVGAFHFVDPSMPRRCSSPSRKHCRAPTKATTFSRKSQK